MKLDAWGKLDPCNGWGDASVAYALCELLFITLAADLYVRSCKGRALSLNLEILSQETGKLSVTKEIRSIKALWLMNDTPEVWFLITLVMDVLQVCSYNIYAGVSIHMAYSPAQSQTPTDNRKNQ